MGGHVHEPGGGLDRTLDRRLWATAVLNSALTLAELVGGLISGSLALLSDAAPAGRASSGRKATQRGCGATCRRRRPRRSEC